MPEISVIVPVYNTEQYLRRCLDSIIAQTFEDFELILIDDGSTDTSGIICDEYAKKDSRVRVFHQINQGQAAARNHALDWMFENSDSKYVSFIDSDDWVHPQYLELLFKGLQEDSVISACRYCLFSSSDEIQIQTLPPISERVSPDYVYTRGEKQIYTYVWGILYERSLWKDVRFPVGVKWEDTLIFHRVIFAASEVSWVDYELYYYFRNPNGTAFSEWNSDKMDYIYALQSLLQDPIIIRHNTVFEAVKHSFTDSIIRRISFLELRTQEDKKFYGKDLYEHRKALRRFLRTFHRDYPFSENQHLYEAAFPKRVWLYWEMRALLGKMKRMVKKWR